jgi:hypothetical protein
LELDRDLMKMLARRGALVSRIRGGKDHAATPAAVRAEKNARLAWEEAAPAFSKDPRFSRDLFSLLQDIRMLAKEEIDERGAFHLSPPGRPVSGILAGPSSTRAALMWTTLAAVLGLPLTLGPVSLSDAVAHTCKALAHLGAPLIRDAVRPGSDNIVLSPGKPLVFKDAAIHAADTPLTLYLLAFIAAGTVGTCRFTGGAAMKNVDLSGLRHTLPLLGARLAHVIPRSQGLPALVECSGMIPAEVSVPADLPLDGVCALLIAPLVWNIPVTLRLGELPATLVAAALAETGPIHREMGARVDSHGACLRFTPGPTSLPRHPALPLSPALSACLLALPAFAGGSVALKGQWPAHLPQAVQAESLLAWGGLTLNIQADAMTASASRPDARIAPMPAMELCPGLAPLFFALAALRARTAPLPLPELLSFEDAADVLVADDFLPRLGLRLDGKVIVAEERQKSVWVAPNPFWGMALALSACVVPGLRMANPALVTSVFPAFWRLYNALPVLADPAAPKKTEETAHDAPARRRIIAD